jgi:3-dehydroquinate synthase
MNKQSVFIGNLFPKLLNEVENYRLDSIYILTDENTNQLCLNLLGQLNPLPENIIKIKAGDDNKNIEALASVWQHLSKQGATRKSLLINLGGGMVTDLGGFAASTFKRGMEYINIPTTLLGAIDAAVGGKNGINFNGLKNEVGVINPSKSVLIDVRFFKTLDHENFLSGYAEMIKHGLISNNEVWNHIVDFDLSQIDYDHLPDLLRESIEVKQEIVKTDPTEKGIRKALNFGHTIGHAFESYALKSGQTQLHGYAVAWGMISELYLSYKKCNLDKEILRQAVSLIKENYGALNITCKEYDLLYELMTHDKKNEGDGRILFTLLGGIGDVRINTDVTQKEIFESLDYYRDSVGL